MTRRVLLIRPDHNEADAAALHAAGWDVVVEPWLEVRPAEDPTPARELAESLRAADDHTWLAVTSPRTWPSWRTLAPTLDDDLRSGLAGGLRVAAVGPATARTLPDATPVEIPAQPTAQGLVAHLLGQDAGTLLAPGSSIARDELATWAQGCGWDVRRAVVYETGTRRDRPAQADAVTAGSYDAVVVRSPSAARALAWFASVPREMMVVAVGPTTAATCRELGGTLCELPVVDAAGLAEKMETLL